MEMVSMPAPIRIYSVSQLNSLIKGAISQALPGQLIVRGQIRDWKLHRGSGHCYFSLKDEGSILPCVMWASKFRVVKFQPEDGMEILATGALDVYLPGGKYQFYADKLDPQGVGALQVAFEQMVAKLEAEGLFAEEHKQPIPRYPRRIGILTSESGAALHDIQDSVTQRWPAVQLCLCPVPVQGEGAGARIAKAIGQINLYNDDLKLDLLIVGRGGGSLEDLWAFNEEALARAIFKSTIPIISAVGHEVDVTVADLVADARASTPTKAGMVAVPDRLDVAEDLEHWRQRLVRAMIGQVQMQQANLDNLTARELFHRPESLLQQRMQQIDELSQRIPQGLLRRTGRAKDWLQQVTAQVQTLEPHRLLGRQRMALQDLHNRNNTALMRLLNRTQSSLETQAACLNALNPKGVLQRGYSITRDKDSGQLVRQPTDLKVGSTLVTEFAGEKCIESQVTKL